MGPDRGPRRRQRVLDARGRRADGRTVRPARRTGTGRADLDRAASAAGARARAAAVAHDRPVAHRPPAVRDVGGVPVRVRRRAAVDLPGRHRDGAHAGEHRGRPHARQHVHAGRGARVGAGPHRDAGTSGGRAAGAGRRRRQGGTGRRRPDRPRLPPRPRPDGRTVPHGPRGTALVAFRRPGDGRVGPALPARRPHRRPGQGRRATRVAVRRHLSHRRDSRHHGRHHRPGRHGGSDPAGCSRRSRSGSGPHARGRARQAAGVIARAQRPGSDHATRRLPAGERGKIDRSAVGTGPFVPW